MKQLMLATVASLALSLPAMAQSNNTNTMQPDDQSQMSAPSQNGNASQDQSGNQQAQNTINPSQLDRQQIRRIQTALDHKGFNVKRADGKWGPETEAAVKRFQQKQNLQGNGQLDQQTLGALGVNMSAQQGSATTGSGSHEKGMDQSGQNPGMTNPDHNNGQNTGSGTTDNRAGTTAK